MTNEEMSYDRSVYLAFREINERAYRQKVKFVQERRSELKQLTFRDRNYIEIEFLLSLFEIGDYERFLKFVDEQIETVIQHNIISFKEKDIFYLLIQNKALSLFHLYRDEESLLIAKQMKKMNSESAIPKFLILEILKRKKRGWYLRLNGVSIFLILLTAGILFFELLVIRTFYEEHVKLFEYSRNVTIVFAILILLFNRFFAFFLAKREAQKH